MDAVAVERALNEPRMRFLLRLVSLWPTLVYMVITTPKYVASPQSRGH